MTLPALLCGGVALALATIAVTRRGKNLPSALAPLPGETTLGEWEITFSERPKRPALYTTQVYMAGRARLTTERLILTQPALFTGTPVLRFVLHFRPGDDVPAGWRDGYTTFVVAPAVPHADGGWFLAPVPESAWLSGGVLVRGPAELGEALGKAAVSGRG